MKLPDIDYTVPLENPVEVAGRPYQAAAGLAQALQAGFSMLGQERIKTQVQEAGVVAAEGLSALKERFKKQEFITQDEVAEVFGKDGIPNHIQSYFDGKPDPLTGKPRLIPMYEVQDAIFHKRGKEIVDEASKAIQVPGWQADFQAKALEHVEKERHQLALSGLQAANGFLAAQQAGQAERLWNAGDFEGARQVLATSLALPPAMKEKLEEKILEAEQVKPIADALISGNRQAIEGQIARLRAGDIEGAPANVRLNAIAHEKKASFEHTLQVRLNIMDREKEDEVAKAQRKRYDQSLGQIANLELAAARSGQPFNAAAAFSAIPMDNSISGEQRRGLVNYVQASMKPEGERKTDFGAYQAIRMFAVANPEDFAANRITITGPDGKPKQVGLLDLSGAFSGTDLKHLIDMQAEMQQKGANATKYRSFLDDEQLVNTALRNQYGYDLKSTSSERQEEIGRLKRMVDLALRQAEIDNGGRLTTDQRNATVDKTLRAEVKIEKGYISGRSPKLRTAGVDGDLAQTLRHRTERAGAVMSDDDIIATAKDYGFYEAEIVAKWEAQARKPISTDDAVGVYALLKSRWDEIDASLKDQGVLDPAKLKTQAEKDAANKVRAAAAVQLYLRGVR